MLQRLILKVTKFQLPIRKRFSTVVKNILGGHHAPAMSNGVNFGDFYSIMTLTSEKYVVIDQFIWKCNYF